MRLTTTDLERIQNAQHYFAALKPVGVELSATDIVRIALRELQDRLSESGGVPEKTVEGLFRFGSLAPLPTSEPGLLTGGARLPRP